MGNCCVSDKKRKRLVKALEILQVEFKEQRKLLSRIMTFDMNIGKNPVLTICKRFARENTNDAGD